MKILVTGGNGFLGSWVVRRLCEKGHSVRVLHRARSDVSALAGLNCQFILGDITDRESLKAATKGAECVFHVAGLISYAPRDYGLMEKVNVAGTQNVVDACIAAGVNRMVFTSSVVSVGASSRGRILTEKSPFNLSRYHFGYYETKRKAEDIVIAAVKIKKFDGVVVNPAVMFGAGDAVKDSRKTHLKVAAGKFPFYASGGVNVLHVDDAVTGHLEALEKGKAGERYILGGENLTIKELFEMIAEEAGVKPPSRALPNPILHGAFGLAKAAQAFGLNAGFSADTFMISTLFHWYDSTKAKTQLGFKTRPARLAIAESISWSKAHGYLNT